MMKFIAAALVVALPQVAQAATPPRPCLSRADASELSLYVLPSIIPVVVDRCRASLPAQSWLVGESAAYAQRLAAERQTHWAGARRAIVAMAGERPPAGVSDNSLRSLIDDMVRSMLPAAIDAPTCQTIEDFSRLLAPLPSRNLGELTALLAEIGSRDANRRDFQMCPSERP
jgi:hypothetical protein